MTDTHSHTAPRPLLDRLEPRLLLSADFAAFDLGTLGGQDSWAFGINDVGQVVGAAETGDLDRFGREINRAFIWTDGAGMFDIGTLGGPSSWAYAISNRGHIVGYSETDLLDADGLPVIHAFLWESGYGMTDLGTLGGRTSGALDVNDHGQVVGWAENGSFDVRAFLYSAETGMLPLGTFSGEGNSVARAINADGLVTGEADTGYVDANGAIHHAFLYSAAEGMYDLDTLGGDWSLGADVNDLGEVVGWAEAIEADPAGFVEHAFLDTEAEGMVDVSPYDGVSAAYAVNNYAEILADVAVGGEMPLPYLSRPDGSIVWLDEWGISEGHDLNEPGQIVGAGLIDGDMRAMLLDPARPWVTVEGAEVAEGDAGSTALRFDVTLSTSFQDPVTLNFTTLAGSAKPGEDYAHTEDTVTFAPGETTAEIFVTIYGDNAYEDDERLRINIWSPEGDVTGARPLVTILNDDVYSPVDLDLGLDASGLASLVVPGDLAWQDFTITNLGSEHAFGWADVQVYLSRDFTLDDTDAPIGGKFGIPINLPAGTARPVAVASQVPAALAPGQYYLLAEMTTYEVGDANPDNDVVGEVDPYDVVWRFGTFGGRRDVRMIVPDTDTGHLVVFKMVGAGYGEIDSTALSQVTLQGTNAASKLVIKATGAGVSVGDITTSGASIDVIKAPGIDLAGDVDISGGSLRAMVAGNLVGQAGRNQTIRVGAGGPGAVIVLDRVSDLTMSLDGDLRKLVVADWLDTDGDDLLTARSAYAVVARPAGGGRGDWQADVRLTGADGAWSLVVAKVLGDMTGASWTMPGAASRFIVAGALRDSRVRTGGSVMKLVAGRLERTDVLAGVADGFAARHIDQAGDLVNPLAEIRRAVVIGTGGMGPMVTDSNLSAGRFDVVKFRDVDPTAPQPFGLWATQSPSAQEIRAFVGDLTTGEPFRWLGEDDDGPFEPIDALVVRLV